VSRRALGLALALAGVLVACTSPEATRMRAGGPGADTGNHGRVVQMHEGSSPYWRTPRLLANRPSGSDTPAALPR
jgi:hypothetical protein